MEEFEYPQDAFKANIGKNDFDEIDSQYVESKNKYYLINIFQNFMLMKIIIIIISMWLNKFIKAQ